jgi:hypothetical protein
LEEGKGGEEGKGKVLAGVGLPDVVLMFGLIVELVIGPEHCPHRRATALEELVDRILEKDCVEKEEGNAEIEWDKKEKEEEEEEEKEEKKETEYPPGPSRSRPTSRTSGSWARSCSRAGRVGGQRIFRSRWRPAPGTVQCSAG